MLPYAAAAPQWRPASACRMHGPVAAAHGLAPPAKRRPSVRPNGSRLFRALAWDRWAERFRSFPAQAAMRLCGECRACAAPRALDTAGVSLRCGPATAAFPRAYGARAAADQGAAAAQARDGLVRVEEDRRQGCVRLPRGSARPPPAADRTRAVAQAACVRALRAVGSEQRTRRLVVPVQGCAVCARGMRGAHSSRASQQRASDCRDDWGRRHAETRVGLGGEPQKQQLRRPPRPASSL